MPDEMKLEACPFCGGPAELEHESDHHGAWFNLGCARHWGRVDPDKACVGGRLYYTDPRENEPQAIAAWNARVPLPPPTEEEVQEVARALDAVIDPDFPISDADLADMARAALSAFMARRK